MEGCEITNYEELGDDHSARVIDGEGLYLIPGLWDAHVHYAFDDTMRPAMNALFLAHGVTSVRDTGGPLELVTQVRIRTLEQPMKAPNVYIAGPLIDGSPMYTMTLRRAILYYPLRIARQPLYNSTPSY